MNGDFKKELRKKKEKNGKVYMYLAGRFVRVSIIEFGIDCVKVKVDEDQFDGIRESLLAGTYIIHISQLMIKE